MSRCRSELLERPDSGHCVVAQGTTKADVRCGCEVSPAEGRRTIRLFRYVQRARLLLFIFQPPDSYFYKQLTTDTSTRPEEGLIIYSMRHIWHGANDIVGQMVHTCPPDDRPPAGRPRGHKWRQPVKGLPWLTVGWLRRHRTLQAARCSVGQSGVWSVPAGPRLRSRLARYGTSVPVKRR